MSQLEDMLDTLQSVYFLHDIDESHLRPIASIAQIRKIPEGCVLFREGQDHREIYLVVEGSMALEVRVSGRETKRLQTVGKGELLGWSPLLGQVEMTATARALRPSQLIAIDGTQLLALCEHNPRFGLEFMRRTAQALSKRLSATRLQLLDVYNQELPAAPTDQEG
jgi:CRP-like cAMP-binding protein